MKNIKLKLLTALFVIVLGILIGSAKSNAASASISASSKNVSTGTKVTITVSGSAKAWSLKVSGSGVSGNVVGGNLSSKSNQSFSESYTLNTSSAGTYKVSLSGDVTDANGTTSDISDSVTVTVSEKSNDNNTNNNTDNNKKTEEKKSEPTFKSANDTMYATGDINVRKSYSADSEKIGSLKAGEKVTRTGIGDNGWSKVSYNGATGYIKTSLLTDKEQKKSDDKTLKSLSIEGVELNPAFDPEITDYAVTIDKDVDKLDIKAEPNNENAKVEITGNEDLKDGDNFVKITVTAEDETTRLYSITVTKGETKGGLLSTLKVPGYTLTPAFSPSVKEYKISVLDANVNSVDIVTESNLDKAKINVTGNTGLKEGENTIIIKVSSEDGSKTDTYKIIVTKNSSSTAVGNTNQNNKSSNWILYAGIAIIVILIIAIIVVIIMSRRNAYYEDDEEYEDEESEEGNNQPEDYSDLYGYSTKSEVKNTEPSVDANEEKEKFINESIYGEKPASTNNEKAEEPAPKYEDGFNYNAFNSQNVYGDYNDKKVDEPSGIKDVDYYSNKVSEMFDHPDAQDNKTTDDAFGYLPKEEPAPEVKDEYTPMDNNWSDDNYRPRRSKGKHSK